jgi:pimeloyl-ACP methyl ester carboxylesterase
MLPTPSVALRRAMVCCQGDAFEVIVPRESFTKFPVNRSSQQELPELFRFENGGIVRNEEDWLQRRKEIATSVISIEFGGLPPNPFETTALELHRSTARQFMDATFVQYRVSLVEAPSFGFRLDVLIPPGQGPFPVVLTGDACWRYVTDEITREVLARGHILAQFSRVEVVPDNGNLMRIEGLHLVYPEGRYGALSAWAWGYHRCVDVLRTLPEVDLHRIAVVGHSRGGKAALLAGATDERIALTAANNSGCGGAGCFRWKGPKCETLGDILRFFPDWFGPGLKNYVGKEESLPFDQHSLKALVAPRPLLCTEALDDLWANPSGTWLTHQATREVYRFLGAENKLGIRFRPGEHDHTAADWIAFLDFMAWHFSGKAAALPFDANPFPDLPSLHSWRAPV